MEFKRTGRFRRAFRHLSKQDQDAFEKALRQFSQNPLHPSLHTEKLSGSRNVWSFRVSIRIRCTFEWDGSLEELKRAEVITLRNIGPEQDVYRRRRL